MLTYIIMEIFEASTYFLWALYILITEQSSPHTRSCKFLPLIEAWNFLDQCIPIGVAVTLVKKKFECTNRNKVIVCRLDPYCSVVTHFRGKWTISTVLSKKVNASKGAHKFFLSSCCQNCTCSSFCPKERQLLYPFWEECIGKSGWNLLSVTTVEGEITC